METSLEKMDDASIICLADEADAFWRAGMADEKGLLRQVLRSRGCGELAAELLILCGEIYHEAWARGLVRTCKRR